MSERANGPRINPIDNICESAMSELVFKFTRSQGPGGQNVNKVNSRATIRWKLSDAKNLSDEQKEKIRTHSEIRNRINKNDEIIIDVQSERTQGMNRKLAMDILKDLIKKALTPQTERIAVETPDFIKKKIASNKSHTSRKKHDRSWKPYY